MTTDFPPPIEGFSLSDAPFAAPVGETDIAHWIYRGPVSGPHVIVLHELPGLSPGCIDLARRFVAAGLSVHLPLLFGRPEQFRPFRELARLCISREIEAFARRRTSRLVDWLDALVDAIGEAHETDRVGVVGMCLTGNFALSCIAHPRVGGAVACQPSLPLFGERSLAMSDARLSAATTRARSLGDGAVIGFRYRRDPLCGPGKFDAIRAAFGSAFEAHEIDGWKHATLTDHRSELALDRTIEFLQRKLR